tara:strand:- start:529 stop:756 length:228 start_codon:yes stop_codon:yes gene_type:complete
MAGSALIGCSVYLQSQLAAESSSRKGILALKKGGLSTNYQVTAEREFYFVDDQNQVKSHLSAVFFGLKYKFPVGV